MKAKTITKLYPIFLCCCMALTLMGCANKSKNHGLNPKNPQEITIWNYYNGAQAVAFEASVNEFNNSVGREKGIIVTAQSKSSIEDLSDALTASANQEVGAEEMPDIFQCYSDSAVVLDQKDILADLNQYITKEERDKYIDSYIEEGIWGSDGSWKLFPFAKSTELLALNKTDWEPFAKETNTQLSKLSTWEGLCDAAGKYYEWSGGRSFFGRDAFANYMIIGSMQLGTELFQVTDGIVTVNLDESVMKRLWDNFYIPYIKGYYKHTGRYRSDDVKIGEILCCVCSTSGMAYFPKEVTIESQDPYPIETIVLPVPNFENTEPYAVQQGASMAVAKSSEQREYASVVFLQWFTQAEQNISYALESNYLPVTKEANSYEIVKKQFANLSFDISDITKESIKVSLEQINSSALYTTKGFEQGEAARNVLETSMLELAYKDREEILARIQAGDDKDEALKPYLTDDYFKQWFQNLEQELNNVCQ